MRPQESVGTVTRIIIDFDHVGGVGEEVDGAGHGEQLLPPHETGGLHREQNRLGLRPVHDHDFPHLNKSEVRFGWNLPDILGAGQILSCFGDQFGSNAGPAVRVVGELHSEQSCPQERMLF